jgi:hypothetical protein
VALSPTKASNLEAEVFAQVAGQRASWVPLAARLAEFHAGEGWLALDYESFNEWLGQPEISLSRSNAYELMSAWRELAIEREVDPKRLAGLDLSKLTVVLPAVRDGMDVEEALSACETLSRSDLRAEFQSPEHAEYRVCEACGSKVKVTE